MEDLKYKVLLVEDNEIERRAFERFVENNDIPYDYVTVKTVSEAQRELACKKFDIVISDHDIGDGTAIDILNCVNDTPVIVVTGAGNEEIAIQAWKAGAYDYLVKDIDQSYLKAIPITVENAIKHKVVEEKLQLLSGAIRSTEDSVYITNMQGEIIFVNKAFCKTYEYSEEEIIGKNSSILWIGKNQSENTRSVFQTRTAGEGWEIGFYHKRKDDSIFPISLSRSTIKDANKKDIAIVGVARDISERLLIEDELRSTSLKFQKRSQIQNDTAICAAEAIKRLLVNGQINKASKVICDFLDITRINAGLIKLNRSKFNFADLVSQVEEAMSEFVRENNIKLTCDSDLVTYNSTLRATSDPALQSTMRRTEQNERQDRVFADYNRVAQVLTNLLLVNIRFSQKNSNIELFVKSSDDELIIGLSGSVCDFQGHELNRIINNCEWIKQQFDAGREDIALGLSVAKKLIEMHGGRIWTERPTAKEREHGGKDKKYGSTLFFTIPKNNLNEELLEQKQFEKMVSANI